MAGPLKLNPAVKLLDWYREALTSETKNNVLVNDGAAKGSETLRQLTEVQGAWAETWTGQWLRDAGYICG